MRVFAVGTGRVGSATFVKACNHATNFSAAHESRDDRLHDRLDFPDAHIEADRLLSWFLGPLAARYPDAFYVHLTRDEDDVVASFRPRFVDTWTRRGRIRSSVTKALRQDRRMNIEDTFAHGVISRREPWKDGEIDDVIRLYVHTVNENIRCFLAERSHCNIDLRRGAHDFERFWYEIGAEGDLSAALHEYGIKHNATGVRA